MKNPLTPATRLSTRRKVGKDALVGEALSMVLLFFSLLFTACNHQVGHESEKHELDSLAELALDNFYRSPDSTIHYSRRMLDMTDSRSDLRDWHGEALGAMGFALFMHMDYDSATIVYKQLQTGTRNELLQLMAEVGMMHVAQRRSQNKEFYDYATSALQHLQHLQDSEQLMSVHERRLWHFLQGDYHMTMSVYYYYVRQGDNAQAQLDTCEAHTEWFDDNPGQRAMFLFLAGNTRTTDGNLNQNGSDYIRRALALAARGNYPYVYSKALTTLADDVIRGGSIETAYAAWLAEHFNIAADSIATADMPLYLSLRALKEFKTYGSPFDVAQTYITISDYYLYLGANDMALNALLRTGWETDTDGGIGQCPELMVDIHEHLSMVYAALGDKVASDHHRNVYLDLLDATRQDRLMEGRLQALQNEEKALTRSVIIAALAIVLLCLLAYITLSRLRRSYRGSYERERSSVEREIALWRDRSDDVYTSLTQKHREIDSLLYIGQQRLAEQKRQYADRLTCLEVVGAVGGPLDRLLAEIRKMRVGGIDPRSAEYASQLTDHIMRLGDALTGLIKMRKGAVLLHIESFQLQPLFSLVGKNPTNDGRKQIEINVCTTDAVVRADRALTLFMLNTLIDNARKFVPETGGRIDVEAEVAADYVEISVRDNGCGMSEEDVATIMSGKIYDASKIGQQSAANNDKHGRTKGYGFGLMNTKAIIEKYRSEGGPFAVCHFGIESRLGEGSRFYFRLPKGIIRVFSTLLLLMLPFSWSSAQVEVSTDSPQTTVKLPTHPLLEQASAYADSAYFANVERRHADALQFADSACVFLNQYCLMQTQGDSTRLLHLRSDNDMPEIDLFAADFPLDYTIVLDLRNESAVAALALCDWDTYYYNNEIYTRLYKLMAQDKSIEQYCRDINETNTNRRTLLIVSLMLVLGLLIFYYTVYYRTYILPTFKLRQLLALNQRLLKAENEQQVVDIVLDGINDIRRCNGVAIHLDQGNKIFVAAKSERPDLIKAMLMQYKSASKVSTYDAGHLLIVPLFNSETRVATLAMSLHSKNPLTRTDRLVINLLSRYLVSNIYHSLMRSEQLVEQTQRIDEERRRAEAETYKVHVQNMVLDNCLSTIKHETMYYPSRMHTLAKQLADRSKPHTDTDEILRSLESLCSYYKDIFSMLAEAATRSVEDVNFQRNDIPLHSILSSIPSSESTPQHNDEDNIDNNQPELVVLGDEVLIRYLLDNIVKVLTTDSGTAAAALQRRVTLDDEFVKIELENDAIAISDEQISLIFYPESLQIHEENDNHGEARLLIAKQIIRLHDDFIRRGCRIEAHRPEGLAGHGLSIMFTLPIKKA